MPQNRILSEEELKEKLKQQDEINTLIKKFYPNMVGVIIGIDLFDEEKQEKRTIVLVNSTCPACLLAETVVSASLGGIRHNCNLENSAFDNLSKHIEDDAKQLDENIITEMLKEFDPKVKH